VGLLGVMGLGGGIIIMTTYLRFRDLPLAQYSSEGRTGLKHTLLTF